MACGSHFAGLRHLFCSEVELGLAHMRVCPAEIGDAIFGREAIFTRLWLDTDDFDQVRRVSWPIGMSMLRLELQCILLVGIQTFNLSAGLSTEGKLLVELLVSTRRNRYS